MHNISEINSFVLFSRPYLIYDLVLAFRDSIYNASENPYYDGPRGIMYSNNIEVLFQVLQCSIGFLLFSYARTIAQFLLKRNQPTNPSNQDETLG